jgi:hypothetical protein
MFSAENIFRENDFPENIFRQKPFYVEVNGALVYELLHSHPVTHYILSIFEEIATQYGHRHGALWETPCFSFFFSFFLNALKIINANSVPAHY